MTERLSPLRRVVTGHNDQGQSIIIEDGAPPRVARVQARPGYAMANVWRTAASPSNVHDADSILEHKGVLPPKHGTVIRVIDIPPEPKDPEELEKVLHATFRELYPDADHTKDNAVHQGMHKTATVDYAIVLAGSITAIMDEDETILNAGDILIQRGTNHAWSNRSEGMCRIAFVLVDGRFE
ncbi:cupin domain-containing protein [Pararhodobacter oceanensis]|uniref:cupin domain-containing protein n=1 Tax=Pararhodobacter oceanensis TaxID=2172121 RepID=UPI003A8F84BA